MAAGPDRLTALGPYFPVETHDRSARPDPPWRPLSALVDDPAVLAARIDAVRTALAGAGRMESRAVERRVAASTAHLGLVARVVAPALGLAAIGRPAGPWRLADVWWQDRIGGPLPLSVPETGGTRLQGAGGLLDEVVEPLTDGVAAAAAVSPRVLWGNVASAANTAARLVATADAALAPAAWDWAAAVLADPRLATETRPPGPGFRRSSCCLLYRLAGGRAAICGDCVLSG
jgi:hypothetical protein